jgi:hypothetical protein
MALNLIHSSVDRSSSLASYFNLIARLSSSGDCGEESLKEFSCSSNIDDDMIVGVPLVSTVAMDLEFWKFLVHFLRGAT